MSRSHSSLLDTVLDTTDARGLAEFYRQLLDLVYRPGDEVVDNGLPEERDWLVLTDRWAVRKLAFQQVAVLSRTTWPDNQIPQQMHLDVAVSDMPHLQHEKDRAIALGAEVRLDRSLDPEEPLWVMADPAGHLFCLFVSR